MTLPSASMLLRAEAEDTAFALSIFVTAISLMLGPLYLLLG